MKLLTDVCFDFHLGFESVLTHVWCKRVVKLTKFNNIKHLIWTGYKTEFWEKTAHSNLLWFLFISAKRNCFPLCRNKRRLILGEIIRDLETILWASKREKKPLCVCILGCFCFAYIANPKIKDRLSWYVWYLFWQSHVEHY